MSEPSKEQTPTLEQRIMGVNPSFEADEQRLTAALRATSPKMPEAVFLRLQETIRKEAQARAALNPVDLVSTVLESAEQPEVNIPEIKADNGV